MKSHGTITGNINGNDHAMLCAMVCSIIHLSVCHKHLLPGQLKVVVQEISVAVKCQGYRQKRTANRTQKREISMEHQWKWNKTVINVAASRELRSGGEYKKNERLDLQNHFLN